jgi:apolipoprotein N-acyltransferase
VANTGISALIQPDGDITARTELFSRAMEIEIVDWRRGGTIYTMIGDLFAETCFVLGVIALLLALFYRRPVAEAPEQYESGLMSDNGQPS